MFGSPHASPELSDALLCKSCDRRNVTVSCKIYLSPLLISHSLSGWSFQSYGRSLQCPPNSCRNPVIPAEPGGFWNNEVWQEGLLFWSFRCLIIPAEFGHSGIETGMFRGMRRNGMQRNPVVYLFSICLLIIRDMSQLSPLLPPPPL